MRGKKRLPIQILRRSIMELLAGVTTMSLSNVFVSARKAMAQWRERERAYAELMALDDRSLADIGIRRSEIAALVEGVHGPDRSPGFAAKPRTGAKTSRKAA
jgi:uncharacterized protein YjiS (DUF1127 family)